MQDIRVTFKILNPDSVAKQWSDIKVRYYFTPRCRSRPMVIVRLRAEIPGEHVTTTATTSYVEIGFAAGTGTLAGFDNVTGSDQIQLHLYNYTTPTWNTSQDDDYSYKSCAGVTNTTRTPTGSRCPATTRARSPGAREPPL